MKSADLISAARDLFEVAADVLIALGGERREDVAQLYSPDGYLFNLFADGDDEWRTGRYEVVGDGDLPDLSAATSCYVECRSEVLFSTVVRAIGERLSADLWVLDGDFVAWPSDSIDVDRLRL